MIEVSFFVHLDWDKIQAERTLNQWVEWFNVEHDAFTDRDDVTWNDLYLAIATDFLTGGEWSDYVTGNGWDVVDEDPVNTHTHTPDCHVTCPYLPAMGTLDAKAQQYPGVTVINDPVIGTDVRPSEAGAGPVG